MTFGKYKRLLLVVTLPLLLVGFLVSKALMPSSAIAYRLCEGLGNIENCRSLGEPGDVLYERTKQQSTAWFQVNNPEMRGAHDVYMIEANARMFGWVTVDSVAAYTLPKPTPLSEQKMKGLIGRPALLQMGIEKGQRPPDTGSEVYLSCHTLDLDLKPSEWIPKPGPYTASCWSTEWEGRVSFTPSPEAEKQLVLLRDAVNEEVSSQEREYWGGQIFVTLLPLVLFLILSAVVWLTRRATAFVKAG